MSLILEVFKYPKYREEYHYRLFQEAWDEYFSSGGQARLSAATLSNLYERNPAGTAFLAIARDDEIWAGSLSAIPFRVRINNSSSITAYQISDAIVSPRYRRRSILTRLVDVLTRELSPISPAIVYTFPNTRSLNAFLRNGYQKKDCLPTRFHFPGPAAIWYLIDAGKQVYRKCGRPLARYREVNREEAARITSGRDTVLPRLVRDGDYLKWRYFQPPGEEKFQFWAIEPVKSGETFVAVTTHHRYGKRTFTVFLELLPQSEDDHRSLAAGILLGLGRKVGAGLLYTNEKIRGGPLGPAWGISLPRRLNPRPIELLVHSRPGNGELEKDFLRTRFTTADWLGFL